MPSTPDDRRYAKTHEWAQLKDGIVTVGISDYAQDALTDVVFVELPSIGDELVAGAVFGTVESVKSVSELYAPVAGKVVEVNSSLESEPEKINDDPYGAGWIIRIEPHEVKAADGLLAAADYQASVADDGH